MTLETVRVRPPEPSWTDVMAKLESQVGNHSYLGVAPPFGKGKVRSFDES